MAKQLELKVYTNNQLAEWFGITPSSLSKYKKKKLEELKAFADFEEVGNKKKKVKIRILKKLKGKLMKFGMIVDWIRVKE